MKFSDVTNPHWANEEHTAIDCIVTFEHINEPVPFTANPQDSYEHGREIFALCESGEFGPVADYVPPPPPPEPVKAEPVQADQPESGSA